MSIEVNPVGIKCNLGCKYCYQDPMRDAGQFGAQMDIDKMIAALDKAGQSFTVFGGEALLTPLPTLERLFKYGYERYGTNAIQTNGALITDSHLELFRLYNVHVGFSMDGPAALNDLRWAGSLEKTRAATEQSHRNLYTILRRGELQVSLICTLHRRNGVGQGLETLKSWFNMLGSMGLKWARLHLLEVDSKDMEGESLTTDEAFQAIIELEGQKHGIYIDMFSEIPAMLRGDRFSPTCIWTGCDPFKTGAVHGINPDGTLANCGRVNKDGINWLKPDTGRNERYHALINTPQEYGGCKGCRYFPICNGECPGESADWRNKTRHCELLKKLFAYYEEKVGYFLGKNYATDQHGDAPHGDHYDFGPVIRVEVKNA